MFLRDSRTYPRICPTPDATLSVETDSQPIGGLPLILFPQNPTNFHQSATLFDKASLHPIDLTIPKPENMPITFLHTADWQLGKPYARNLITPGKGRGGSVSIT